jgi:hypothetical protein
MGAMSYWKAIAVMLGLAVLSPFTYGFSDIVILFLLVMLRQHLHALYKHTQSGVLSWFQDCCFVFCCNPFLCCQLVQEAREVETDPIQYVKFADTDPAPVTTAVQAAPVMAAPVMAAPVMAAAPVNYGTSMIGGYGAPVVGGYGGYGTTTMAAGGYGGYGAPVVGGYGAPVVGGYGGYGTGLVGTSTIL